MAGHIATAGSIHHGTPERFIERARLMNDGIIDLDPCSNETSIIHATTEYLLPKNDGLIDTWAVKEGRTFVWCNPPFGRYYMHLMEKYALSASEFKALMKEHPEREGEFEAHSLVEWVRKANDEFWVPRNEKRDRWAETIMILPAAIDTSHWHKIIFPNAVAWLAIKGRLKYLGAEQSAPMASALVYWGNDPEGFEDQFGSLGRVYPCDGLNNLDTPNL